jgi:hypothetical protein
LACRLKGCSVALCTDEDQRVKEAVLAYLAECQNATDTKAGVAEWWLMRQHVRTQVEAVARVLEELVDEGVLEAIGSGDQRRYRMKRS